MKDYRHVCVVALLILASLGTAKAGPPLDRPSPPPYCADGVCRPNALTFGWYQTRWRRWPTESLEPTPADAKPPGERVPELPSIDIPRKEDEDRAAPPPTKAAERARDEEEAQSGVAAPEGEAPGGVPFLPPGGVQPRPSGEGVPAPTLEMPWERQQPTTPTTPAMGPTGDLDPPPAPPFSGPSLADRAPGAQRPEAVRPVRARPRAVNRGSSDDPPPAYPLAQMLR